MNFFNEVKKRNIVWPTQRGFDCAFWYEKAKEIADNEDWDLVACGLWTFDTLEKIRTAVATFYIWDISWKKLAQYFIAMCNRDLATSTNRFEAYANETKNFAEASISFDKNVYDSIDQKMFGSPSVSDLLESGIDAVQRCLEEYPRSRKRTKKKNIDDLEYLRDLQRSVNYVIAYETTEGIFYKTLWLNWQFSKEDDEWKVFPIDVHSEKILTVSWIRFYELMKQFSINSLRLWDENLLFRKMIIEAYKGVPRFSIRNRGDYCIVTYDGKDTPHSVNFIHLNQALAREMYYIPLVTKELPHLGGKHLLDFLYVNSIIGIISEQILGTLRKPADEQNVDTLIQLETYCCFLTFKMSPPWG